MKLTVNTLVAMAALAAAPAFAQEGDPVAGEKAFSQCQTCHVVVDASGTVLAGRAAKTGPNLYGVVGRPAGSMADFKGYGEGMKEAGAKGLVWDEEHFTTYVKDPTKFLKEYTGDPKVRGKMTYKVRKEEDAHNIWAFLSTFSAAPAEAAPAAAPADAAAPAAEAPASN